MHDKNRFPEAALTLHVQSFFHASTSTWTYVVADSGTKVGAIIDPVLDFDSASGRIWHESALKLLDHVRMHALRIDWILETHAHADHLSAAGWLKDTLAQHGNAPQIGIGAGIVAVQGHFANVFALGDEFSADGAQFDYLFADGERFEIGSLVVEIIATPGHTPDSISYQIDDTLFV
ncbi:MAG TPA: MBL fold metallo-hydrolase, partial [Rudaea sp.]|nr:MBL fold metallo-hydrolase [Rudaea sp.]